MSEDVSNRYDLKTADKVDYDALCADWEWEHPEHVNIATRICDSWAAATPDRMALYWENEQRVERSFTFREIADLSNQTGNALRESGIDHGDTVALYIPSCPELLTVTLGSLKIGALNLPLYQLFGPDGLETRIRPTSPSIIFTDPEGLETLERLPAEYVPDQVVVLTRYSDDSSGLAESDLANTTFEEWVDGAETDLTVADTAPEDPAQIFFTSGTTGEPKGVVQPHRTIIGHQYIGKFVREYHHEDLLYHIGSFAWAGGFNNLMHVWALGAPMAKYDGKFDPAICLEMLEKYDVDILMSPPTALRGIMDLAEDKIASYDIDLRVLATGGERVSTDILEWAESTFDIFATTIWGQTECYGIGWPAVGDEHQEKLGTAGKVLPGYEAAILDDKGNELGHGEVGQLAISREVNPTLFLEYYDDPEATAEVRHGRWHRTGDAAFVDEDGYYWIEGRMDDIIISAGYRLSPSEIESSLNEHPAVMESGAVPVDDERRTNTVRAYVQLNSGYDESDALRDELQAHVKDHLAKFQYPDEIRFIDDIPKTITGKIQRKDLAGRSD
jgi:acetyl-CoA synthetase